MTGTYQIVNDDCLNALRNMPDNSIDAIATDPPYGLSALRPEQVAEVIGKWSTSDREAMPSAPRKGRKNCLSQIILRTQGDSDGEDTLARKDFINVPITFSSTGFPMFRAVDFNDDSSFREIEVNDVSPEFTLDDELVNGFFSEFGKERQDVEFRLWALKGCPGCVGVCTCLTEPSQGVGAVPVRLGYYALADTESATPVVTLRVTEVSAVLSFDGRRRSFELSPAGSASEGDGLVIIVSPKGVGAVAGAGGLATVFEPGLVGGVGGAADGACSADFVAHVDLLDRLVNPSLHPTGFMGKGWDVFVPPPAVWDECLRVLKPGGHMAVFSGARTQDLMGLSIRLAGFEIRETCGWIFGSGFPKSMDISKAIGKAAGATREVVGRSNATCPDIRGGSYDQAHVAERERLAPPITAPATDAAKQWDGWGTALKPAIEPIILARKPLDGTVANNVLTHGVGGLNIDACRVPTDEDRSRPPRAKNQIYGGGEGTNLTSSENNPSGRFPANVLLDEHAAAEMDKQSGVTKSSPAPRRNTAEAHNDTVSMGKSSGDWVTKGHSDSGGASRFFPVFKYQPKAPKRERPVVEREDGSKVQHPTVKPVELMRWITALIVPEGGTVLDPFAGSGTTLQAARDNGFTAIGIEREPEYVELIEQRMGHTPEPEPEPAPEPPPAATEPGDYSLFP